MYVIEIVALGTLNDIVQVVFRLIYMRICVHIRLLRLDMCRENNYAGAIAIFIARTFLLYVHEVNITSRMKLVVSPCHDDNIDLSPPRNSSKRIVHSVDMR